MRILNVQGKQLASLSTPLIHFILVFLFLLCLVTLGSPYNGNNELYFIPLEELWYFGSYAAIIFNVSVASFVSIFGISVMAGVLLVSAINRKQEPKVMI
jgi:hypothetical protein